MLANSVHLVHLVLVERTSLCDEGVILSPRAAGFTPSDGKRADASGEKADCAQAISASVPLGQFVCCGHRAFDSTLGVMRWSVQTPARYAENCCSSGSGACDIHG